MGRAAEEAVFPRLVDPRHPPHHVAAELARLIGEGALARRLGSIPEINRPGRIWIGINNYTTAAPALVAENFRLYTEATIIGEPTIEKPVHDGNKDFLKLPNSGLQIFYPTALRPLAKGSRDALYPDITVEMTFDAFKNGRDPVLDYVRKKID